MTVRVLLEPPPPGVSYLPTRRPRRRGLWKARWALLVAGVAALGYSGYAFVESYLYQTYEDWSFERERSGKDSDVTHFVRDQLPVRTAAEEHVTPVPAATKATVADRAAAVAPKTERSVDDSLIGRIAIPRLNVRAIVKEGVDERTLRRAVGHVPETVRPGTPGNVGLAGHRDSFFRRLRDVRKNDRIVIETLNGKYEYEVESTKVVTPADVKVLAPTKESVLTLVTCYPFHYVGNAPKRYIVRARQVSADEAETSAAVPKTGSEQAN